MYKTQHRLIKDKIVQVCFSFDINIPLYTPTLPNNAIRFFTQFKGHGSKDLNPHHWRLHILEFHIANINAEIMKPFYQLKKSWTINTSFKGT